ncbi:MAG: prepilin-type N-terminal cleavage/methylation domain-containing protein, partial [Gemmatimonadetes bacterium]|nr:prepilin-type N-terminal cleavage/methylation domain-containing protein [Gemmatimonadota bacterium]
MMRAKPYINQGFTLIELLVV